MLMNEEDRAVFTNIDETKKKGKATIEDTYQKKSQLEHILLRPDTYIGSVEYTEKAPMWVYDTENEKMVLKDIKYVPGLYKIFDEILVNAADNKQRDAKMNLIKITINKQKNEISVFNNGKGIPVAMHKVENMYVPELIFGTLLTSSNYNDDEKKVTGGRNGYGAKLCNIFSTEFTLETSSKEFGKCFKQTWKNNMTKDADADLFKSSGDDFTKVTFKPDLKKFKMSELDDDIIALMCRRAYDVAGSSKGVKVFLNGKQVPVTGFKQYVEQYTKHETDAMGEPLKVCYEQLNDRWEVALTVSDKGFQQVSFVNSIATSKGGRHVDYVADQMVQKLIETIKKKVGKSTVQVKPFQVKNHMWVFVNSLIENPTFDSQTKETMTLQSKSFGSKCEVSDKFAKQAQACGIVDSVLSWVKFKQMEIMDKKCSSKKTSKLKGIPKLEDANDAGTKNSHLCTLILTEGDSAKTLAVSGLGVVGRDRYGVFPLRGKLLNVREGNLKQVADNAEINALLKILGLQYKMKYDQDDHMKTLRYGKVMVMADQDQDGSHIKGLVINFIHHNWPQLIRRNFVEEFITPIVKATKGKEEMSFFSIPEYNEWRNNTDNWKTFKIKYYKGLGTSTSKEAKEYFSDMARHRIKFKYGGPGDDEAVDMAFSKKKIEERKDWLTKWMQEKKDRRIRGLEEDYLYNKDTTTVSFSDFINKELVLFSNTDNERSIPCLVDGFKPGQRKVLFACFKRADKREVKVAQLAGAVGELSAYHHGEQSLMGTIVNLAQDFVGSNNINLLLPIGQFGTRLQGGKDSASPRYIFTQLSPVTRTLFPIPDDNVLRFLFEENQKIEPEWYCPIIPIVLVNGASGIGTGWSTQIPNYNPRQIVENIRRLIKGEECRPMAPFFKGFRGEIVQLDPTRFVCSGEIAVLNDDTLEITELPVKTWTQGYKESVLEPMLESSDKKAAVISDFKEYHTDTTVKFVVKVTGGREGMRKLEHDGLHKVFKLQTVINTSSMVLFDANNCLRKFASPEEICREFYKTRKVKYEERKRFLEGMLKAQSDRLSNQARFILAKIKGEIVMENKKKASIVEQLIKKDFEPDPVKKWKEEQKKKELEESGEVEMNEDEDEEKEEEDGDKKLNGKLSDYDYLVGMALIKLSEEEKNKLMKESEDKLTELKSLQGKTWADLWEDDIKVFMEALDKQEAKEKADQEVSIKNAMKKFAKDEPKGKKKNLGIVAEVFPSKDAIRVEPLIDKALKEKYEKIDAPKKERKPKEVKEKKPKVEGGDIRKFATKKEEKKKKKEEWNSDESSEEEEEEYDEASDDDMDGSMVKRTTAADRKTKARISDSSKENGVTTEENDVVSISDDDEVKEDKKEEAKKKNGNGTTAKVAPKKKKDDDEIFDISDDSDFDDKKKTKKPQKRKSDVFDLSDDSESEKKPPPKKKNDEKKAPAKKNDKKDEGTKKVTDFFSKKEAPKKAAPKKKKGDSDSEIELDDSMESERATPPPKRGGGRAKAPVKYNIDDDDSDDAFPQMKKKKNIIDSDSD
ncbi:top-2 [Pristionchus pacificus]|nr:top-2 [Pristionchus pacificus]